MTSKPITRVTTVTGLMQHTNLADYETAGIILNRLAAISEDENPVQIMQRLNPARAGRCPCCGFRLAWTGKVLPVDAWDDLISEIDQWADDNDSTEPNE